MRHSQFFVNQLSGVWKSDETVFQVFDFASQTINNSLARKNIQSNRSPNFVIIIISVNLLHGSNFLCFLFINYQ